MIHLTIMTISVKWNDFKRWARCITGLHNYRNITVMMDGTLIETATGKEIHEKMPEKALVCERCGEEKFG